LPDLQSVELTGDAGNPVAFHISKADAAL